MEKNGSINSPRRRSLGVILIAIIQILLGILTLVQFIYADQVVAKAVRGGNELTIFTSISMFGLLFATLLGISLLIFGLGLLRLKNWARISSMVFAPFVLFLFFFISAFLGPYAGTSLGRFLEGFILGCFRKPTAIIYLLSFILLYFVYIYYFTRPKVKEQFK